MDPLADQSIFVLGAINGVVREALIAACLTAVMILIFLGNWRSTLIIATSIPLAILTSLIILSMIGETINIMTLGGLALAVGILVDDATVEVENINRNRELHPEDDLDEVVLLSASQIATPAFVSTLSICIVFAPMFMLSGVARYLFLPLAEAVVFAMLASYFLSRTVVPMMAKYLLRSEKVGAHAEVSRNPLVRLQKRFEAAFERFRENYHRLLERCLHHRRAFLALFFAACIGSLALLVPWLGQDFFPSVDAGSFRTILETTRAQAVDVGVARAQYEHAVAVLIGKPPADFTLPPLPLTVPPPPIPVGLPSELLERRPDVASAERQVAAANTQIGLAKLAYYPVINLTASGGFDSAVITTLFQGPSAIWSVGPTAAMTLVDFGRRRAFNDEAKSGYDYAVASYRQTALTAFQQVEDNLAALRILENEAGVQAAAVDAAKRSLDLSVTRYEGGVTSYLEVITAQNAALTNEVTAVNILGRRLASAVLLVQALGGGWDRSTLPQRPECCGKLQHDSN